MKKILFAFLAILLFAVTSKAATILWDTGYLPAGNLSGNSSVAAAADTICRIVNTASAAGRDTTAWFPLIQEATGIGTMVDTKRYPMAFGDSTLIVLQCRNGVSSDSLIFTPYLQTSDDKITFSADSVALAAVSKFVVTTGPVRQNIQWVFCPLVAATPLSDTTGAEHWAQPEARNSQYVPLAQYGRLILIGQAGADTAWVCRYRIRAIRPN